MVGRKPVKDAKEEVTIPVVAEDLRAGVRKVTTGGVRVKKTVRDHEEIVDQPLESEHVEVRRVVRNEVVSGPLPVRQDGDTTIIPVVKQVLKLETQWVLTEEVLITKRRTRERSEQTVSLRSEEATLERLDAEGNAIGPVSPSIIRGPRPQTQRLPKFRGNKVIK